MALLSDRNWDDWIAEYAKSHCNAINRRCHAVGIPMIAFSVILALVAAVVHPLIYPALALFGLGWVFQFVGHAFERKPPEFFKDWRFLFVGLRWWMAKVKKGSPKASQSANGPGAKAGEIHDASGGVMNGSVTPP